jgi:predicted dehydrogenase
MYKALLLGCGNIGALYDLDSEEVLTHAKAYTKHPQFELTIFDLNKDLQHNIAEKYNADILNELSDNSFEKFDCISICTPTSTHFELLSRAINNNIKVIICEKPISNNIAEIVGLENLYHKNNSKVLVNYIRRFQPAYTELKKQLTGILAEERLTNISIRYQRGFINNCSHALDLLQFLTDREINLKNIVISNRVFDHFESDPTLSMNGEWDHTYVSINGLPNVKFSLFEIDLYFEHTRISIQQAGKSISYYHAAKSDLFLQPLLIDSEKSKENCLNNYMNPVIDHAYQLLNGSITHDTFLSTSRLNQLMLNYIKN